MNSNFVSQLNSLQSTLQLGVCAAIADMCSIICYFPFARQTLVSHCKAPLLEAQFALALFSTGVV